MTNMKRFELTSLGLLTVLVPAAQAQKTDRPNIIVIQADDMGFSDLGCYGGEIQTFNPDKVKEVVTRHEEWEKGYMVAPRP